MANESVHQEASSAVDAREADQAVVAPVGEQEQETLAASPATPSMAPPVKVRKDKKKKKDKKKSGTLGSSRGVETMFRTSYRVNMDLSSLADNKSNIMISINGLIISIILGATSTKIDSNSWLLAPTLVLLVGCLISMVYAVLAARPRVSSNVVTLEDVRKNNANILFFGNFARMAKVEYVEGMTELMQNTDLLYYTMIVDIYGLGSVLQKKFRLLRLSYTVFMVSLVAGVLVYIFVFILVAAGVIATPGG